MKKDKPGHSVICRDSYPAMIRSYSEYLMQFPEQKTISYPIRHTINENKYILGFRYEYFCIFCKSGESGLPDIKDWHILMKNVTYTTCYKCIDCKLCPRIFVERKNCLHITNYLVLLTYMRDLPTDIFKYIIGITGEIPCICDYDTATSVNISTTTSNSGLISI